MMETMKLGARLRAARKAAGYRTSKEFIEKNKIPASTYSQYESGARIPDDETLKHYSKIFFVNFLWLKNGKGTPYVGSKSTSSHVSLLKEELFNLKSFNCSINQSILSNILCNLLSTHNTKIPLKTVKSIVKHTLQIYENISSLNVSQKNQMKLLRKSIKEYKSNV